MRDLPVDDVGAFVVGPEVLALGSADGPLAGRTLAVKDLFDVAGTVTGAGNPTFAAGRPIVAATAPAVLRLLAAGATVVGKTVTDELAYSLAGANVHHGTPVNSTAPGHAPGGSSSGSAAAVSAGLVDLGLGTDTGGSIRVPASYGGLWGWRPTHGAVPIDGVVPLAPSFDTVGLLARDPVVLVAGAAALLRDAPAGRDGDVARLVVPTEARHDLLDPIGAQLDGGADRLGAELLALGVSLDEAAEAFRVLQGAEAWRAHGDWITSARPTFGPDIAARFAAASRLMPDEVAAAAVVRERVQAAVLAATADGTVLLQVAAAAGPPALDADPAEVDRQRLRTLRQTSLAGLAGCPVVSVPVLHDGALPLGLACVGAPGTDGALLAWAAATFGR